MPTRRLQKFLGKAGAKMSNHGRWSQRFQRPQSVEVSDSATLAFQLPSVTKCVSLSLQQDTLKPETASKTPKVKHDYKTPQTSRYVCLIRPNISTELDPLRWITSQVHGVIPLQKTFRRKCKTNNPLTDSKANTEEYIITVLLLSVAGVSFNR